jgi:general secretion pathway protein G
MCPYPDVLALLGVGKWQEAGLRWRGIWGKVVNMILRNHLSGKSAAYTLVEIMLVLAIISVLLAAGIYYLSGNLEIAKEKRVEADIETVTTQLKTYEMQNMFMPTTEQGLAALVTSPSSEPRPRRWRQLMEQIPQDPWGTPYQYRNPGKHNPQGFDLYSWGPDRRESEDDIGNWTTQ